jgi:hypothetical protein
MGFEVSRIPQFTNQLTEPFDESNHDITGSNTYIGIIFFLQEVVTKRTNVNESLEIAVSAGGEKEKRLLVRSRCSNHWL